VALALARHHPSAMLTISLFCCSHQTAVWGAAHHPRRILLHLAPLPSLADAMPALPAPLSSPKPCPQHVQLPQPLRESPLTRSKKRGGVARQEMHLDDYFLWPQPTTAGPLMASAHLHRPGKGQLQPVFPRRGTVSYRVEVRFYQCSAHKPSAPHPEFLYTWWPIHVTLMVFLSQSNVPCAALSSIINCHRFFPDGRRSVGLQKMAR